jgi:hypothetical protein
MVLLPPPLELLSSKCAVVTEVGGTLIKALMSCGRQGLVTNSSCALVRCSSVYCCLAGAAIVAELSSCCAQLVTFVALVVFQLVETTIPELDTESIADLEPRELRR